MAFWQVHKNKCKEMQDYGKENIYYKRRTGKMPKGGGRFTLLEGVDVMSVDAGRYGFVKLQYYTPPTGFENNDTFTDSRELLRICGRNG